MIVRGLDGRDSSCWLNLLWARRGVAVHGTYYHHSGLRDLAGSLELLLLTLTPDWEQENQGAAAEAKKALILTTHGQLDLQCNTLFQGDRFLHHSTIFKVKLFSRHVVGMIGRHGQLVVEAIDRYRKGLCLKVEAETAVDKIRAPSQIHWALPGGQRVRMALLETQAKSKVKVEHSAKS